MNELRIFNYEENEVRMITIENESWWVAKDICDVFGETNRNRAMSALEEDEKGYTQMMTPGGRQQTAIVNESGLYSLLFTMQPTKARGVRPEYIEKRTEKLKKFKRWVTHDVLPSIRKNGMYAQDELLDNPDLLLKVVQKLKTEKDLRLALETKVELDRPKVLFAEALETSKSSILIGELAKVLKQNGVDVGQNRLFTYLRDEGYLCSRGERRNQPTQRGMDLKLFEIKKRTIINPDGSSRLTTTTKITGKGQSYFVNKFLDERVGELA